MIENNEGLTKIYNRFHDPNEKNPQIATLRSLQSKMDKTVLNAYGWDDISTDCRFIPNYENDDDSKNCKKKPWRYRWPDEVQDEVLSRLIGLNAVQAEKERMGFKN